ncbi:unnamed protein product, partial [Polarella glacialis]
GSSHWEKSRNDASWQSASMGWSANNSSWKDSSWKEPWKESWPDQGRAPWKGDTAEWAQRDARIALREKLSHQKGRNGSSGEGKGKGKKW